MTQKRVALKKKSAAAGRRSGGYWIPLLFTIPLVILCILMIRDGLRSETTRQILPFVEKGGVFRYKSLRLMGLSLYQILMMAGFVPAAAVTLSRRKRFGLEFKTAAILLACYAALFFAGAKLYAFIEYLLVPGKERPTLLTGQNFFGSLYSSLLAIPLLAGLFHRDSKECFDFVTPFCLISLFFTKLGCFTAGCCDAKWRPIHGIYLQFPVQLFEAVLVLVILALCLRCEQNPVFLRGRRVGSYPFMLITYSTVRFLLEGLKPASVFRVHCAVFFAVGILMIFLPISSRGKSAGQAKASRKKRGR